MLNGSNSNSNNNNNNDDEDALDVKDDLLWSRWRHGNAAAAAAAASGNSRSDIVSFNNAGASPLPRVVLQTVTSHLEREAAMGGYLAAQEAQGALESVYVSVAELLQARCALEIALVESATVGWTRIFYSMVHTLQHHAVTATTTRDAVILVSQAEYAANVVAMVKFAREENRRPNAKQKWRILTIPCSPTGGGVVDVQALDSMLAGTFPLPPDPSSPSSSSSSSSSPTYLDPRSIVLVCITHIPTNSGIVNPVEDIGKRLLQFNTQAPPRRLLVDTVSSSPRNNDEKKTAATLPSILYLVDACQSVGQVPLNVQTMHCHALTGTGRKYLRGPRGSGFLYVASHVVHHLIPSHVDHYSALVQGLPPLQGFLQDNDDNESLSFVYAPGARRFEFWESSIASRLGLGAAISFGLFEVPGGMLGIQNRCRYLACQLRRELRQQFGSIVNLHHDSDDSSCAIVTFGVEGFSPEFVQEYMLAARDDKHDKNDANGYRFELSIVPATSTPIDSAATSTTTNLVRASLSYFNTQQEVDAFCAKLKRMLSNE